MRAHEFLKLRLVGKRFQDAAIPLEFLKDLAVLEEMIVEVAKGEFRKANPGRQRIPRGFTDGIELRLTGIEAGSAIPLISLVEQSSTLFPHDGKLYFERARDSITAAMHAAETGGKITDCLPQKSLCYFDKMGRGLREGEFMEFCSPSQTQTVKLSREMRRRLVHASATPQTISEETWVRGLVPEADQDNKLFEIQLPDGQKIKAPISLQHRDSILHAFNGYQEKRKMMFHGVAVVSYTGRLVRFDSIEHVTELDPLDVGARLDELRLLEDGWMEGEGKTLSKDGLNWLEDCFRLRYPEDAANPYLYPTTEGDLRAEWSNEQWDVSLHIHLAKRNATWHALNLQSHNEEVREQLKLDEDDDWNWIVAGVKSKIESCL